MVARKKKKNTTHTHKRVARKCVANGSHDFLVVHTTMLRYTELIEPGKLGRAILMFHENFTHATSGLMPYYTLFSRIATLDLNCNHSFGFLLFHRVSLAVDSSQLTIYQPN